MTLADTSKICFVIGPIGAEDSENRIHADWLFDGIIEPVFAEKFPEFRVERADKISTPGMVTSQIISRLYEADLVIADLSFHNANAFYEMAIRHNVGKPIIHMIRKGENIPFDVIPHRAIPFSNQKASDHRKAKEALIPVIAAAIEPGFEADNPIKHALGQLQLQKTASPELKVLADDLTAMRGELLKMSNRLNQEANINRMLANRLAHSNQSDLNQPPLGDFASMYSALTPSALHSYEEATSEPPKVIRPFPRPRKYPKPK